MPVGRGDTRTSGERNTTADSTSALSSTRKPTPRVGLSLLDGPPDPAGGAVEQPEQAPQIVESVSHLFNGARLSIYGEDARLMGTVEPLVELLGDALRGVTTAKAKTG